VANLGGRSAAREAAGEEVPDLAEQWPAAQGYSRGGAWRVTSECGAAW
jgi:hypothetical protein